MAAKQEEGEEPRTKLCGYCQQHIQEDKFELHEVGCKRYFTICKVCNQPVPKKDLEQHNEEHIPVPCDLCGEKLLKERIETHKETTCPDYQVICKYCQLEIRRGDHEDHIEGCGSRTDLCELCGQRVILRDMYEHQQNKCAHMKADEALDITQLEEFQDQRQELFGALLSGSALGGVGRLGFPSHPLGFDMSSPHHHHQPAFVHPFVPLPTEINHGRSYPREPDPPPPKEQSYPQEPDPREGDSMHVDPQWLASVANVCGEEGLDSVLAHNMAVEDLKRHNPLSPSPPLSPHVHAHVHVPQQRGLETVHSGFARGAEMGAPQSEMHMQQQRDAELARELYEGDMAYAQRYDMPFSGQETTSDSLLAKQIHDREVAYCESQDRDHELARKLQEEEERQAEHDRRISEEEMAKRDHELAKQAQERERLAQFSGRGGLPESGLQERGMDYQFQQRNTQFGYHNTDLEGDTVFRDSVQGRQRERADVSEYNRGVLDNEEPRPKTPPFKMEDAEKIPCQFCNKLYPFEAIDDHQRSCSPASTVVYVKSTDESFPLSTERRRDPSPLSTGMAYPSTERRRDPLPQSTGMAYPSTERRRDPSPLSTGMAYPSTERRRDPSPLSTGMAYPSTERRRDPLPQSTGMAYPSTERRRDPLPQSTGMAYPSTERRRDPPPQSTGMAYPSTERRRDPPSSMEYAPSTDYTAAAPQWSRREESSPYVEKNRDYTPPTQWREEPSPYVEKNRDYTPPTQWREYISPWDGSVEKALPYAKRDYIQPLDDMEDKKACPCEFCGQLFSIKELIKHEPICKVRKSAQAQTSAVIQNGGGSVNPYVGGRRVNPHSFASSSGESSSGERSTRPTTKSAVHHRKLAIKFPDQQVSDGPLLGATTNQQRGVLPAATSIGQGGGGGRQQYAHTGGTHRPPAGHNGPGDPLLTVKGVKIQAGPPLQVDRRKPPVR